MNDRPLTLNINQETMQALVGQAILQGIDQEARDELIQTAIDYLIKPSEMDRGYGRRESGPSPLEAAFKRALDSYASGAVERYVESNPEVKEIVDTKIGALIDQYKDYVESYDFTEQITKALLEYANKRRNERY